MTPQGFDLIALREELLALGRDYQAIMRCAAANGFCAVFTPTTQDDEPALCMGIWTGLPFDRSEVSGHRAAAAVVYCSWNRM